MNTMRLRQWTNLLFLVTSIWNLVNTSFVNGYCILSPPVLGLGAILFRPQGTTFRPSLGDRGDLTKAGEFFTDAFWYVPYLLLGLLLLFHFFEMFK